MRHLILTLATAVAMCGTAAAADLTVAEVPAEAPATSSISGYLQLMGGWVIPNALTDYDVEEYTYDFDAGWALGATLGIDTPIDGVSLEIDVLRTMAGYGDAEGEDDDELNSTSLMANVVYSFDLNDVYSLYGGAGLGLIGLDYVSPGGENASGRGAAYQVFAGVQAAVAENVALTFEARYQSTFDNVVMEWSGDDYQQEFNRTSILAGVLFSF